MRVLQANLPFSIEVEPFKVALGSLHDQSNPTASGLLGEVLAARLNGPSSYSPLTSQGYGFGSPTVISDLLLFGGAAVAIELTQGSTSGGIFGMTMRTTNLTLTALAPDREAANLMLSAVCKALSEALPDAPFTQEMLDPAANFFIAEERRRNIEAVQKIKDGAQFTAAEFEPEELALANALRDTDVREFAFTIIRTGQLLESKFVEELSSLNPDLGLSDLLVSSGFLTRETFIDCRKTQRTIARFPAESLDLGSLEIRCGGCNRLYRDENIYSAFSASLRLRELMDSSRWMNILVTDELLRIGVPREGIFWNVTFGTDELDVIAFVDGVMWIFELKDREFSQSDAHHFNYRRSIIKPSEAFVITTTFVSPDAKRVMDDVSGDTPGSLLGPSKLDTPVLIEGLDKMPMMLTGLATVHQRVQATRAVRTALRGIDERLAEAVMIALR